MAQININGFGGLMVAIAIFVAVGFAFAPETMQGFIDSLGAMV